MGFEFTHCARETIMARLFLPPTDHFQHDYLSVDLASQRFSNATTVLFAEAWPGC